MLLFKYQLLQFNAIIFLSLKKRKFIKTDSEFVPLFPYIKSIHPTQCEQFIYHTKTVAFHSTTTILRGLGVNLHGLGFTGTHYISIGDMS